MDGTFMKVMGQLKEILKQFTTIKGCQATQSQKLKYFVLHINMFISLRNPRSSSDLRRGAGVGGREGSSWLGLPGLVVTISSSTRSRASGERGLLGVFAPLEASVLHRLEVLT